MSGPEVGRLHVIVSDVALARAAAAGGADLIQYRDKRLLSVQERRRVAHELEAVCTRYACALVVNDDPSIAAGCRAAGVHVGAQDPSPRQARRMLGSERWIGATANGIAEAIAQSRGDADYLGVGPVFATRSKERAPAPLGLDLLERIVKAVNVPVIAIGGIDLSNIDRVLERGPWGVAVLSAVAEAEDPIAVTRSLKASIDRHRSREVRV